MKNRPPCEHGDLCHTIWKRTHYIYSIKCPYKCEFYKPKRKVK